MLGSWGRWSNVASFRKAFQLRTYRPMLLNWRLFLLDIWFTVLHMVSTPNLQVKATWPMMPNHLFIWYNMSNQGAMTKEFSPLVRAVLTNPNPTNPNPSCEIWSESAGETKIAVVDSMANQYLVDLFLDLEHHSVMLLSRLVCLTVYPLQHCPVEGECNSA